METDRLPTFLLGAVIGLVLGAVLVAGVGGWFVPTEHVTSPTSSTSTATGCVADPVGSGWLMHVPSDDSAVVAFHATVVHETSALDVQTDLSNPAESRHVLAISTTPVEDSQKGSPPDDCLPTTTIDTSVTLPREFGTLGIVVDGRTVASVDSARGTAPTFRPLDSPVG